MAAVTLRDVGPVTIVELPPSLALVEGTELRRAMTQLLVEGRCGILLDCARLSLIDNEGLRLLVRCWMGADKGRKLKLFHLKPSVKETFHLNGLLKVMDCFDDIGSALHGVSRRASAYYCADNASHKQSIT